MYDTPTDFIVVGAGSAGCVLANRLSADPTCRVLLLEAGAARLRRETAIPAAFTQLFKTEQDWDFVTDPLEHLGGRRLHVPRGKGLGGSSAINAMMYVRGHRADYDGWAAAGCAGWSYDEVLPYFRRSERNSRGASRWHGADGPLAVSDVRDPNPLTHAFLHAAREVGIPPNDDFNGPALDGAGFAQVTQRRGRRCSAADAFLTPIRRRPNLSIVTGAHTTRVLVEGGRAVGVEYVRDGTREIVRAERAVVLCLGAIGSPQLLMLSGIGPADQLRRHGLPVILDLPGVGQNLNEHFGCVMRWTCTQPVTLLTAASLPNLLRFLLLGRGPLTSNIAEAAAFVRTQPGLEAPDLEIMFGAVLFESAGLVAPSRHGFSLAPIVLQPRSRGSLRLRSADPFDKPHIQPAFLSDRGGDDLRTLLAGMESARRIAESPALRPYRGAELAPGPGMTDAAFVRAEGHTNWHPAGTCRMGVDPLAVVDPALRVRGIEGPRIADASVMPSLNHGHPHAPVLMIAERACDLIRDVAVTSAASSPVSRERARALEDAESTAIPAVP